MEYRASELLNTERYIKGIDKICNFIFKCYKNNNFNRLVPHQPLFDFMVNEVPGMIIRLCDESKVLCGAYCHRDLESRVCGTEKYLFDPQTIVLSKSYFEKYRIKPKFIDFLSCLTHEISHILTTREQIIIEDVCWGETSYKVEENHRNKLFQRIGFYNNCNNPLLHLLYYACCQDEYNAIINESIMVQRYVKATSQTIKRRGSDFHCINILVGIEMCAGQQIMNMRRDSIKQIFEFLKKHNYINVDKDKYYSTQEQRKIICIFKDVFVDRMYRDVMTIICGEDNILPKEEFLKTINKTPYEKNMPNLIKLVTNNNNINFLTKILKHGKVYKRLK